eukprot:SAG11_NODE_9452_length_910_cov_1.378545_1_plen_38_part_10
MYPKNDDDDAFIYDSLRVPHCLHFQLLTHTLTSQLATT